VRACAFAVLRKEARVVLLTITNTPPPSLRRSQDFTPSAYQRDTAAAAEAQSSAMKRQLKASIIAKYVENEPISSNDALQNLMQIIALVDKHA
jgi:hypothetical protein